ncbi:MAG TPA: LysR substrate-binding domain-containing protein [Burkholderiaceae bacterium]|nr:LysR substrate-binding domain-containing protein [Burkholderiaceae bacterium]
MKPHQLQAFLAVAEHGSIRAAARQLFVSQPAVTRTVRELEASLDVPLVMRGSRGVELTEYGKAFHIRARLLVEEARRAREELQQLKRGMTGLVRIGVSSLPAMVLLPDAFALFRKQMPQAELQCYDGQLPVGTPLLRSGELDFLITQAIPEVVDKDLSAEVLFTTPLTVAARSTHPRLRARSLAALLPEEWIGWDRVMIGTLYAQHGLPTPERILISRSFEVTQSLIEKTDLIGLFSLPLVERKLVKHGIRPIRVREELPPLSVCIVMRRDARLTPASAQFLQALRALAVKV